MSVTPKPTHYNGYYFRSKLEAKWAVFFDLLNVLYVYEPEAFRCAGGAQYTPDFFLPEAKMMECDAIGMYLEVKPIGWEYDPAYCNRIQSAIFPENFALLSGDPHEIINGYKETNYLLSPKRCGGMEIMYCQSCLSFKVDFADYKCRECSLCGGDTNPTKAFEAAAQAREYRFEFIK